MTEQFIHLIQIPLTGVGIRPFRGQEWFKNRIEIFKKYTLNSLLNQTNKNFTLWITMRPEESDNLLTKELESYLKEKGFTAFMSFDGLMYVDDKFIGGAKEKLMNLARIIRMAYLQDNPYSVQTPLQFLKMLLTRKPPLRFGWGKALKELFRDKNKTLRNRLSNTLGEIKETFKEKKYDWVYVSRIDSDDMFSKDFVAEVQSYRPFPGALTCRNGYVYNSLTGQLADWRPKTNPPFHTIIFPKEEFLEADRYIQYFKSFKSHEDIPKVFHCQNLKDGNYCVLVHNQHISTLWNHPWLGGEIKENKQEILSKFGI